MSFTIARKIWQIIFVIFDGIEKWLPCTHYKREPDGSLTAEKTLTKYDGYWPYEVEIIAVSDVLRSDEGLWQSQLRSRGERNVSEHVG